MSIVQRLVQDTACLGVTLSEPDAQRLLRLLDELERWNRTYNLTAIRDRADMLTHHLLDSLSIHPDLRGTTVADVGTGAGFPGLPLAVVNPERRFTLIDSNGKKIRFVQHAARELGLKNVEGLHMRVEASVARPGGRGNPGASRWGGGGQASAARSVGPVKVGAGPSAGPGEGSAVRSVGREEASVARSVERREADAARSVGRAEADAARSVGRVEDGAARSGGRVEDGAARSGGRGDANPPPFDTVVARAFAALPELVVSVAPLCGPGTRVLAMKGKWPQEEIDALPAGWHHQESRELTVPGLDESRCVIVLSR